MNFLFVLGVVLVCVTVCNGQFKILGLLDTKSDADNGKVENIRSVKAIAEPFLSRQDAAEIGDLPGALLTSSSDGVDGNDKGNVNFIKPYEVVTDEWKRDFVEASSDASVKDKMPSNALLPDDTNSEDISGKDVAGATNTAATFEPSTIGSTRGSTTTIAAKAYRRTFQPNIRKFSYIEARSFNHPDSPNHVSPVSQLTNYKFKKVLNYRNKYKSKCRCERIWNCPKIQISIQRCETDYFMCCF